MAYNTCKHCGVVTAKSDICLYCKSKQSHCKENNFYQKRLSIHVLWCKRNGQVMKYGGGWLCDDCKNNLRAGQDNA